MVTSIPLDPAEMATLTGATQTCAAVVDAINAAYATLP